MRFPHCSASAEMRFQGPKRSDENAGRGFLTDAAAIPALFDSPCLQRALPADDMPDARPRRRGDPADRLDRPPYRVACRLDAQNGSLLAAPRPAFSETELRQVERAQRVELRGCKARPKILPRLSHAGRDRAA